MCKYVNFMIDTSKYLNFMIDTSKMRHDFFMRMHAYDKVVHLVDQGKPVVVFVYFNEVLVLSLTVSCWTRCPAHSWIGKHIMCWESSWFMGQAQGVTVNGVRHHIRVVPCHWKGFHGAPP